MPQRFVALLTAFLLLGASCTGASGQGQESAPSAVSPAAATATPGGLVDSALVTEQIACTQVAPNERPGVAIVAAASCSSELLDAEQRACATQRGAELANLPLDLSRLTDGLAPLSVVHQEFDGWVPHGIAELVEAVPGVSKVVRSTISFDVFVADETGVRVGPQSSTGAPVIATNWLAIVAAGMSAGTPPGLGEFVVSEEVAVESRLVVGDTYELLTGSGQEPFVFAGSFSTEIGSAQMIALADKDALRFLAGNNGFHNLGIWFDDASVPAALEILVADTPGLEVIHPIAEQTKDLARSTSFLRNSVAVVLCMAPQARVALVTQLAKRDVDVAAADCLLGQHAREPFDDDVFATYTDC